MQIYWFISDNLFLIDVSSIFFLLSNTYLLLAVVGCIRLIDMTWIFHLSNILLETTTDWISIETTAVFSSSFITIEKKTNIIIMIYTYVSEFFFFMKILRKFCWYLGVLWFIIIIIYLDFEWFEFQLRWSMIYVKVIYVSQNPRNMKQKKKKKQIKFYYRIEHS